MFHLDIVTPDKTVFSDDAQSISLVTDDGDQVILDEHEPYLGRVFIGELHYIDKNGHSHPMAVSSGFIHVTEHVVRILIDDAWHTKDIDVKHAEEAKKQAESMMQEASSKADLMKLKAKIKIANLHIKAAKKYRDKRQIHDDSRNNP